MLGDSYTDPAAHRDALHNNADYRAVVDIALESAYWAADLVDGVDRATELARDAPLLGQVLDDVTPWRQWVAPYRELYGRSVWEWLYWPVKVFWNGIGDGRHRLTFLRLHRHPEHEVLVRIEHGR